ncbi:clathrin assembly protein [Trifolium pratense]|uniref:Clathrin assembly protein n=1 Tax=Trifolium pratense TaxID=57577 RepID=A0A2K3LNX1_TRIPR|nr:clathrin assembly protein [Trifolium pratense]
MAKQKKLKTLTNNLKDKASVIYALLSIKRHVSSIQLNILRATSHTLSSPPSDSQIAAVLTTANTSHTLPRACINSLMDRLHRTKNSTVALKCLFTLHNITIKGSFILKDQLSCYPSYGGYNFLNLSTFRDDSDFESVQLSSWVRCDVPESLELQRNELVYEIVRMVGEDYRKVQGEILFRLEELGRRIDEDFDVGELNELVSYLKRLEESKENLVLLFVNRRKNNGFWELIKEIKMKGLKKKEEIEGKWITVVVNSSNTVVTELTRFTNPFLEPGQYLQVPPNFATVR